MDRVNNSSFSVSVTGHRVTMADNQTAQNATALCILAGFDNLLALGARMADAKSLASQRSKTWQTPGKGALECHSGGVHHVVLDSAVSAPMYSQGWLSKPQAG